MRRSIFVLGLSALSCTSKPADQPSPEAASSRLASRPSPVRTSSATLLERSGTGRIAYLGLDLPNATLRPGDILELTHYFEVIDPAGGDYAVIVELAPPGAPQPAITDAHRPVNGGAPTNTWKKGEFWSDKHKLRIPGKVRSQKLELLVSLADAGQRLTVEAPPGRSDGRDRIRVAMLDLDISGAPEANDGLATVTIPRAAKAITADGVLKEEDWKKAPILGLADTMGRDVQLRFPTKLRLLYDDQNLYVGYEMIDEDISDPYKNRDDPIYDHETVELFIMPNVVAPALGPYVELQASPSGVIFDAAFTARRQGMDKSFNAAQTVGTKLDGTLNDHSDKDRGWVSEWVVPWKSLRGVNVAPKPGDEWRMNAFRIENKGEYTGWSPPLVGDFHATDRFGRMRFGQ